MDVRAVPAVSAWLGGSARPPAGRKADGGDDLRALGHVIGQDLGNVVERRQLVDPESTGKHFSIDRDRAYILPVIQSARRVAAHGNAPAAYEITVRMGDGSTHVLNDASPASWRPGEHTIVIPGGTQSVR